MEPTRRFELRTCCLRIARTDALGTHLGPLVRHIGAHTPVSGRAWCPCLLAIPHDGPVALVRLALTGVSSGVTGDGLALGNGR